MDQAIFLIILQIIICLWDFEASMATLDIKGSSCEIPIELKNELTRLWRKPLFRKAVKLFLK